MYTYDLGGNITSKTTYTYTLDAPTTVLDTAAYSYYTGTWKDLLVGYDGLTINSDTIGNPTEVKQGDTVIRRYTWEHGRQLASLTEGGTTWNYTYNSTGLRTERTNGTKTYTYTYNGSQLTYMTVDGHTLWFSYDAHGPMYVKYDGSTYQYITNLQGDIIAIANSQGNVVVEYTYDAWGNILSTSGSMASTLGAYNPLRYRGYVYATESRLYYLQSRYYDPAMGRFINADAYASTGQGILGYNMFAYCGNNPVNLADSNGRYPTFPGLDPNAQMGLDFAEWFLNTDENEKDDSGNLTFAAKIKQTFLSILYNSEFSAGVGVGVDEGLIVLDLGGSLGGHYDLICVQYSDGKFEFGQNIYFGVVFSATQAFEFGGEIDLFIQDGVAKDPTPWLVNNNTKDSWTLFNCVHYPLFVGGNIRIGFDLNTFLSDLDEIWELR